MRGGGGGFNGAGFGVSAVPGAAAPCFVLSFAASWFKSVFRSTLDIEVSVENCVVHTHLVIGNDRAHDEPGGAGPPGRNSRTHDQNSAAARVASSDDGRF